MFVVDLCSSLSNFIENSKANSNWDDPSNKLWSVYVAQAEKHDKTMTDTWKIDTDGSLIFVSRYIYIHLSSPQSSRAPRSQAGLFSAVVTGFLVTSLPLLQPNSGDAIVLLLTQISQQQSGSVNSTTTGTSDQLAAANPPFRPASGVVWVNSLWMASLIVALASVSKRTSSLG